MNLNNLIFRKCNRRIKRLIKKKIKGIETKALEYKILVSSLCFIKPNANEDNSMLQLFHTLVQTAYLLFKDILSWAMKQAKMASQTLYNFAKRHPYFLTFAVFTSLLLLITNSKIKNFTETLLAWLKKRIKIIYGLILILLWFILLQLLGKCIPPNLNLLRLLKHYFYLLLIRLRRINTDIDIKNVGGEQIHNHQGEIKTLFIYSLLSIVTFKYIFKLFKKNLLSDILPSPYNNIFIDLFEFEHESCPNDFSPS